MHVSHAAPGPRRSWWLLILLCVAQFMVVLDITVVNVALPSIGSELRFDPGDLAWVITAYALVTGGLLLLGGRAADLLGRRPVFLAGLTIFSAASLASGLATSPEMLIGARAAQGVGAALLTPGALSIIVTTYTGPQHATALAAWGAIGSAGAAAGMLFGGMLTSWLSWEWVFLINVPIGAAVLILSWRLVPRGERSSGARGGLDLPGALTVVAGLGLLVYAVQGAPEHGWGSARTLALLAGAVALLAAFLAIERRVRRPLVAPALLRVPSLARGSAVMFVVTGILVGSFFLNSVYLQEVMGASAIETGLAFLPIAVAVGLAAHVSAHLLPRFGSRSVATAGLALIALSTVLMAAVGDGADYAIDLLPAFVALGLGAGLSFPAVTVTAMNDVAHDQAGIASGVMTTAHEIGAAIGVAVLAAVAATGAVAGSGAAAVSAIADGHGDAFLVAAIAAGAVTLAALLTFPVVRPEPGARMAMH